MLPNSGMNKDLLKSNFVTFDVETTGLDPIKDEIIEVGIVRIEKGEIREEFDQLIKPEIPIPPNITQITGIHPEDCSKQPNIATMIPNIFKKCNIKLCIMGNDEICFFNCP